MRGDFKSEERSVRRSLVVGERRERERMDWISFLRCQRRWEAGRGSRAAAMEWGSRVGVSEGVEGEGEGESKMEPGARSPGLRLGGFSVLEVASSLARSTTEGGFRRLKGLRFRERFWEWRCGRRAREEGAWRRELAVEGVWSVVELVDWGWRVRTWWKQPPLGERENHFEMWI